MNIIVTGGTGLIGRVLVKTLLQDGHKVSVLSRSPDRAQGMPPAASMLKWDAETPAGWGHLVNQSDAIINLAGAGVADKRWTDERKRIIMESRVKANQAVLSALEAAETRPKILIQASAVGYYGPTGDERVTESSPPGDDFLAQVCIEWEKIAPSAEKLGLRVPVLRTGIVITPDGGALEKLLIPFKLFVGGPLGDGKQWFPWIHIEDEVRAIQFLLENDQASGPFNLVSPHPLTNAEFSRVLGRVLNRPAFMPAPAFAMKAVLGELSETVLAGQRAYPNALQSLGFEFKFPTAPAALEDLLT